MNRLLPDGIFQPILIYWKSTAKFVFPVTTHLISNQTDLDHAFKLAFDAERLRQNERSNAENDDHLQSENQNKGLINTIINHNNKIKNIENKFNLIVNNFANSSHVREVVDKTKELEKYVFGGPRPHQSWRKFILMVIIIGALLIISIKLGKSTYVLGS